MPIKDRNIRRILFVEKVLMPVKGAFLLFSLLFFLAPDQEFKLLTKHFFLYQSLLYFIANAIFFFILSWAQVRQWAQTIIKISAFLLSIIDNLFLSFLIPLTGGLESPLYWIYCGLIVRNAINFPKIQEQGAINLIFCLFYGGIVFFTERESSLFFEEIFYLRIIVLILVSICCWGIYALIQRKALELEEQRELHLRQEKIHAIRRLAGEIAHGIKNPLSIINNASYYLEKHISNDNEDLRKHVEIIREEILRSDNILNQIMNYSKLSSVKLTKININQALEKTLQEIHFDTYFPQMKIERNFQKKLPLFFFDEGHLHQILSNLILNAAEAIKEKKDKLVDGTLTLSTGLKENGYLVISISDNGIGIDSKSLDKIFNPFFTTKEKGTGLGLSIVKNLVETYDGSIRAQSEKDKGSTFIIELPIWGINKD